MLNFEYCSPTRLIFGKGEENAIGAKLKEHNAKKIMVFHYGTGLAFEIELMDRILNSLDSAGLTYTTFSGIKPNPALSLCREAAKLACAEGIDYILAVGGGSVIDTAKFVSVQCKYDGDLWEDCFLQRDKPVPQERIPLATIITIAGTGSEASEACLIMDAERGVKLGLDNRVFHPVFSILNPELTFTVPKYQTACGIADIFCHLQESYFTRIEDGTLMDEYIEAMMRTVVKFAKIAIDEPDNYLARGQLMLVGTMANWHLTWCGREDDGAIHHMQEAITGLYDSAHGHGCAVLTVGWLRYAYGTGIQRFYRYFTRVWNVPQDELHPVAVINEGIEKQRAFYHAMGLDTTVESVGVKREDIPTLAQNADVRPHGKTGNYIKLSRADIEQVYELCDHRVEAAPEGEQSIQV